MKLEWNTEQSSWEELSDMKEDYPQMTARHLVDAKLNTRSQRGDRMQAWATKTLRDISRTTRRMVKLHDFHLDDNEEACSVRRATKSRNKKKKKKCDPKPQFKYGVQVPRNIRQAMDFDKTNGNTLWLLLRSKSRLLRISSVSTSRIRTTIVDQNIKRLLLL